MAILKFWLKGGGGVEDFGDKGGGGSQMVERVLILGHSTDLKFTLFDNRYCVL